MTADTRTDGIQRDGTQPDATRKLPTRRARASVPKLLGADFELGNFILGRSHPVSSLGTGDEASRRLLHAGERQQRGPPSIEGIGGIPLWGNAFSAAFLLLFAASPSSADLALSHQVR